MKKLSQHERADDFEKPLDLEGDLAWILSRPCFVICPIAHIFQASGEPIPKKAELEQAFVLHWLLRHYFADRVKWRENVDAELKSLAESVRKAREEETTS